MFRLLIQQHCINVTVELNFGSSSILEQRRLFRTLVCWIPVLDNQHMCAYVIRKEIVKNSVLIKETDWPISSESGNTFPSDSSLLIILTHFFDFM